ncbi:DNA-directed RNA polymerase [Dipodascopsis tothii]|uniref:DNA-directed RNA polymerase n=1 Tax=Dipodascopsis tothii TaxID=44089 RepID=UPI0034CF26F2
MLTFCPNCSNLLLISRAETGMFRFECRTCPYDFPIREHTKIYGTRELQRKQIDAVLGGDDAWKNADQTTAQCPQECGNTKAYFFQLQIRSADEPMTTFLRCTQCFHQWREN